MINIKRIALIFIFFAATNTYGAAQDWTGPYEIKLLDSALTAKNNALITLEGYSNSICSGNRIHLEITDDQKFNQMFSMILGAFHSGKKVDFYLQNSADCKSNRIIVYK